MKLKPVISILLILAVSLFHCQKEPEGTVYRLYFLGGQSNMDGYGYVNELPVELNNKVDGAMIFHGNTSPDTVDVDGRGIWAKLQPGHGVGFTSDGVTNNYSGRFGLELTFAHSMLDMDPDSKIAIIKYSRGGTSIDSAAAGRFGCWEPDYTSGNSINQFDHFLATVKNALSFKDIDGDGKTDKLVSAGILWMQGECDGAYSSEIAQRYDDNLNRLMEQVRKAFETDDLPVAIGRITDSGNVEDGKVWDFGDIIREAQAEFVRQDGNAVLVTSTDNYEYSDTYHYDTEGYIDLGSKFAEAIYTLIEK
ncbi:sialate O-acetylesterase [candidate division KSB1 bacterium]